MLVDSTGLSSRQVREIAPFKRVQGTLTRCYRYIIGSQTLDDASSLLCEIKFSPKSMDVRLILIV
jgi:hypothetical protein